MSLQQFLKKKIPLVTVRYKIFVSFIFDSIGGNSFGCYFSVLHVPSPVLPHVRQERVSPQRWLISGPLHFHHSTPLMKDFVLYKLSKTNILPDNTESGKQEIKEVNFKSVQDKKKWNGMDKFCITQNLDRTSDTVLLLNFLHTNAYTLQVSSFLF